LVDSSKTIMVGVIKEDQIMDGVSKSITIIMDGETKEVQIMDGEINSKTITIGEIKEVLTIIMMDGETKEARITIIMDGVINQIIKEEIKVKEATVVTSFKIIIFLISFSNK
jgi:hypothetical protein